MGIRKRNSTRRSIFGQANSPRSKRRSLAFETCETRTLLAGNITATLVGTTLNIVGDTDANTVFITKPNSTRVTVSGQSTTVNGSAAPLNFTGVLNLNVNLRAGNDTIVIARSSATALNFFSSPDLINYAFGARIDAGAAMFGSVTVQGGTGDDNILMQMSTSGNVSVTDVGGLDTVALIGSTVRGAYSVDSGAGSDFVIMGGSRVVSNVTYSLGAGDDYSYNENIFAGAWVVDLGVGGNTIEFFGANPTQVSSALQPLTVKGNTGIDTVILEGSRFQSIDIDLGAGSDVLSWWGGVQTTGNVSVQGGDGNDQISIDEFAGFNGTRIGGSLVINAGAGANTVRVGELTRTGILTRVTGAITITGGAQADTIELFGVQTLSTLLINSLEGIDSVLLQRVTASTEVIVNLGAGNDSLTLQMVNSAKATLRGGANRDRLRLLGPNTITVLDQAEFEA